MAGTTDETGRYRRLARLIRVIAWANFGFASLIAFAAIVAYLVASFLEEAEADPALLGAALVWAVWGIVTWAMVMAVSYVIDLLTDIRERLGSGPPLAGIARPTPASDRKTSAVETIPTWAIVLFPAAIAIAMAAGAITWVLQD